MANIIISPVYELEVKKSEFSYYLEMESLCVASFMKNVKDVDGFKILNNQKKIFEKPYEMFYDVFLKTEELWKAGHDILFTDIDALCKKPVEFFGKYDEFRCFASANNTERFSEYFPSYFLSGTRYFPQTMSKELWEVGQKHWNEFWSNGDEIYKEPCFSRMGSRWDYEQFVYNMMFYSQSQVRENYQTYTINEYNYFHEFDNAEDATIIAFNAAAGAEKAVKLMKEWSKK